MKHAYRADCECSRCQKERSRRDAQSMKDARVIPVGYRFDHAKHCLVKIRKARTVSRRPVPGSAEWAETRGDDIPSYDVPGDDFDA